SPHSSFSSAAGPSGCISAARRSLRRSVRPLRLRRCCYGCTTRRRYFSSAPNSPPASAEYARIRHLQTGLTRDPMPDQLACGSLAAIALYVDLALCKASSGVVAEPLELARQMTRFVVGLIR